MPFTDDDAVIGTMLEDLSAPALLCSLVHMTGDVSWIRDRTLPQPATSTQFQCGLTADERADVFRAALPAIAAYRDAGCEPRPISPEVLRELMSFLAGETVPDRLAPMLFEDLQFDGVDPRAITWGDEIAEDVKAAAPVIVIGCGQAGILAGIRLAQAGLPFTIVDKNDGPGGTWWENRYPGARVDVGSHQYCYPFRPADHWSEYYCRQPELRDYFAEVLDEHGLGPHCRFGTTVTRLAWDEDDGSWLVSLRNADGGEEEHRARFVISAVGSLNIPRLPDIEGMDTFAGPTFHSSRWPDDLDIRGTRFALIGAGASGFQIAPTIAEDVGSLTIYQRTAQWMFPNSVYRTTVPPGERWALRHLPFYARWFRFMMGYTGIASGTEPYRIDPEYTHPDGYGVNEGNATRGELLAGWIRSQLDGREDLIEKSLPDYPAMGKRILQDDGFWLRNLCRPDVELVRTPIERIVPEGVVTTDGEAPESRRDLLRHRVPPQRLPGLDGRHGSRRGRPAGAVGRGADGVPRHHDAELPEPVLSLRPGHEPRPQRQPLLPRRVPDRPRPRRHPGRAHPRRPQHRGRPGGARRVRRAAPTGDQPARVGPPRHHPQPLQEPGGPGLHAVALGDGRVLGTHPPPRPRGLPNRLTVPVAEPGPSPAVVTP